MRDGQESHGVAQVRGAGERDPRMTRSQASSPWLVIGATPEAPPRLTDPRSRNHNRPVRGTALLISELRGSSSGSSVLLELIYRARAPAAIILDSPDPILALGAIVGREMGWKSPPILRLPAAEQDLIAGRSLASITWDGELTLHPGS